jgi:hypothetical protein
VGQDESKTRLDGRSDHFEVRSAAWKPEDHIGSAFAHAFGQYLRQPVTHSNRTLFDRPWRDDHRRATTHMLPLRPLAAQLPTWSTCSDESRSR